jgi:hypothetical protein
MKERMLLLIKKIFLKLWIGIKFFYRKNKFIFIFLVNIILFRYQKLMPKFVGKKCEIQINSELKDNEHLHVFIIYDETTFQSNDGQKSSWRSKNEQPLCKKGQRQSIYVNDFLTEIIRRLKLSKDNDDDKIPHEAHITINLRKNFDR